MGEKSQRPRPLRVPGDGARWPYAYVAMAIVEVGIVLLVLALYGSLASEVADGVATNRTWVEQVTRAERLASLARDLIGLTREELGSGREVDQARLEAGFGRFGEQLEKARQDLAAAGTADEIGPLRAELDRAAEAMKTFSAQTWVASAQRESGAVDDARENLRSLSRSGAAALQPLQQLVTSVRERQNAALSEQQKISSAAQRTRWSLLAIAVALAAALATHALRLFRAAGRARAAAVAAARSRDRFLAHMGHATRTPMNGIIGMTDLLLDTPLNRDQRGYLESVRASAENLHAALGNLLDYAKIREGTLELNRTTFDLRSTTYGVVRAMAPRAHRKGLELTWQVSPEVPETLRGDAERFRQTLLNLLDNAIKFTDVGEVALRTRLDSTTEEEAVVSVDVFDTGIGIPPATLAHLFAPLGEGDEDEPLEWVRSGAGMGLVVCSELARAMGGSISVQSEVGQGSTFRFTARFGVDPNAAALLERASTGELRERRILVIDHHASSRRNLVAMLRGQRAVVKATENSGDGLDALHTARVQDRPFELALIDLDMPDGAGLELIGAIARDPMLTTTAMVALGVSVVPDEQARCRDLGAAAVLGKPPQERELVAAIKSALEQCRAPAGAEIQVQPRLRSLRILLADDNRIDRTLGVRLLEKRGHTVVAVESGEAAVAAFEQQRFDVILMDVQMPQMDGLEATALIREKERMLGGHVPIVALTAHEMQGHCFEAGMDAYVLKPVDMHAVDEVMTRLVAGDGTSTANGESARDPIPLDEQAALERTGGDRALLVDLAGMCLVDSPGAVERIRACVEGGDAEAVRRLAHQLKGSLLVLAADPASAAAHRLEAMGARGALDGARAALEELEGELKRLRPALAALVEASRTDGPRAAAHA